VTLTAIVAVNRAMLSPGIRSNIYETITNEIA
jgi:hypothetical protein